MHEVIDSQKGFDRAIAGSLMRRAGD